MNKALYTCTVEPHLSGLFTYLNTYLGTNPHSSTESASLIRTVSLGTEVSGLVRLDCTLYTDTQIMSRCDNQN